MAIDTNIRSYYPSYSWGTVSRNTLDAIDDWVNSLKNDNEPTSNEKPKEEAKLVIKKVIFSDPATIVLWSDETKTVVKTQNGDPYDPEKGLAMACMRKMLSKKDYHKHLEEAQRISSKLIRAEALEVLDTQVNPLDIDPTPEFR